VGGSRGRGGRGGLTFFVAQQQRDDGNMGGRGVGTPSTAGGTAGGAADPQQNMRYCANAPILAARQVVQLANLVPTA